MSNHIHYKVWDEITYPFLNFKGATGEVWKWISNFTQYFIRQVSTYPCWGISQTMLIREALDLLREHWRQQPIEFNMGVPGFVSDFLWCV